MRGINWFDDIKKVWRIVSNATTKTPVPEHITDGHPDGYADYGPLPVMLSDNFNKLFDFHFTRPLSPPTQLANSVAIGDHTVDVVNVAGFTIEKSFGVFDNIGRYFFAVIQNIVGNTLTLDTPFDYPFPAGNNCIDMETEMNIDGTTDPSNIFTIKAGSSSSLLHLDITQIVFAITCTTYPEHDQFGDIPGLVNGLVFRTVYVDGETRNIFNIKTNKGIAVLDDYQVYPERSGVGPPSSYLIVGKVHFSGMDRHGSVIRLSPGDEFQCIIQDDLTGLNSFEIVSKGHLADEHIYK